MQSHWSNAEAHNDSPVSTESISIIKSIKSKVFNIHTNCMLETWQVLRLAKKLSWSLGRKIFTVFDYSMVFLAGSKINTM